MRIGEPSTHLLSILSQLVAGIRQWAAEEDGVPDWIATAYEEAKAILAKDY